MWCCWKVRAVEPEANPYRESWRAWKAGRSSHLSHSPHRGGGVVALTIESGTCSVSVLLLVILGEHSNRSLVWSFLPRRASGLWAGAAALAVVGCGQPAASEASAGAAGSRTDRGTFGATHPGKGRRLMGGVSGVADLKCVRRLWLVTGQSLNQRLLVEMVAAPPPAPTTERPRSIGRGWGLRLCG